MSRAANVMDPVGPTKLKLDGLGGETSITRWAGPGWAAASPLNF